MARTLTARFDSEEDAERALSSVAAEVPLRDSAVVSSGPAGSLMLDSLNLSPEDRSSAEQQLSKGGFLLVAQVATESRAETVLQLLEGTQRTPEPRAERRPDIEDDVIIVDRAAEQPKAPPAPALAEAPAPIQQDSVEEQRIPLVEEELRIGKREVVRGEARVHSYTREVPVTEQVELVHEEARIDYRPVNRRLSEQEVADAGLLQERVIEVTEMREEAVVSKEAFVREELVVTKSFHRRVEQINETIRRTEVETNLVETDAPPRR